MSDRELLELAAKAAGVVGEYRQESVYTSVGWEKITAIFRPDDEGWWNPLADDGDALRLAVELQIQVAPGTYNKNEFSAYSSAGTEAKEYWSTQQDELSATRRAIVRAAADIEKLKSDSL